MGAGPGTLVDSGKGRGRGVGEDLAIYLKCELVDLLLGQEDQIVIRMFQGSVFQELLNNHNLAFHHYNYSNCILEFYYVIGR